MFPIRIPEIAVKEFSTLSVGKYIFIVFGQPMLKEWNNLFRNCSADHFSNTSVKVV